jgi:hypothetical protein
MIFARSPNADSLYSAGWKDDYYFYGNPNAYVTRPSLVEKRRLQGLESSFRGAIPWTFGTGATSDFGGYPALHGDEHQPAEESEEDSLLPNHGLLCVSNWADLLLRECQQSFPNEHCEFSSNELLSGLERERSKDERAHEQLRMVEVLLREFYRLRLFARGLPPRSSLDHNPSASVSLQDDVIDPALFLDYLPMLRVMATMDVDARAAAAEAEVEPASTSSVCASAAVSRRKTRNSSRRSENTQLFSDLAPSSQFDEVLGEASVPAILRRLSELALLRSQLL